MKDILPRISTSLINLSGWTGAVGHLWEKPLGIVVDSFGFPDASRAFLLHGGPSDRAGTLLTGAFRGRFGAIALQSNSASLFQKDVVECIFRNFKDPSERGRTDAGGDSRFFLGLFLSPETPILDIFSVGLSKPLFSPSLHNGIASAAGPSVRDGIRKFHADFSAGITGLSLAVTRTETRTKDGRPSGSASSERRMELEVMEMTRNKQKPLSETMIHFLEDIRGKSEAAGERVVEAVGLLLYSKKKDPHAEKEAAS